MRVRLSTDFLTGVCFLALGAFVIAYGSRYAMGSAMRMGPGYFPVLASVGLMLLGAVLVVRSRFRDGEPMGALALRPLVLVLVATLAFGLLIERAGFWVAGIVLVFACRFADRGFRFVEVAGLALFLTALIALIFRYALGLPMRLLPF
jgi:putative tricarboxylic transport membrane protein